MPNGHARVSPGDFECAKMLHSHVTFYANQWARVKVSEAMRKAKSKVQSLPIDSTRHTFLCVMMITMIMITNINHQLSIIIIMNE